MMKDHVYNKSPKNLQELQKTIEEFVETIEQKVAIGIAQNFVERQC